MAMVEPVDDAIGQREMRHVAEEDGGDAMAFEIKRGDCGHGFLGERDFWIYLGGLLDVSHIGNHRDRQRSLKGRVGGHQSSPFARSSVAKVASGITSVRDWP
ncbi:hypothetical protein GCM10007880_09420 [Mesorhizobium amorphae]|nr:hypothetical protein GCM10007880_09420 [Mesorhizobium amorphae]